ncbi:TetR/AcrR family transcriptional regulator [Pseudemcibacter aquimaris]|uniref:TetR/AcrR family transcriptional regulator n=1 Tax=Pseudemcibacter aquimaris TaxID=2857064 RepID=UPI002011A978|nr:TetR/AcrR family transcriptional regulator [Pseudemcibacter aquimaris]MCC3862375.1 TetR/AcrR family transcriptional regulator [Pseudemcibacter aquimaris]WDU59194.1 TetR/AcrR family transcriptional regulator [Pseudemcibacter aquimaris]
MQATETNITREEKRKQKLDVILRNASKAFMEKGYYKTSLDDIAKMQNVTKPTLYYYIKNKEDILVKCEEEACRRINGLLDDIFAGGGNGFQMLYRFVQGYIGIITDDIIRCHVRHRGQMEDETLRAASIQNHKDIESRVREIIRIGITDGTIRDCNSTILAILLFDSLNGITAWYKSDGPVKEDELTEEVLALVTHGVIGD